jgi:hypothetical protein
MMNRAKFKLLSTVLWTGVAAVSFYVGLLIVFQWSDARDGPFWAIMGGSAVLTCGLACIPHGFGVFLRRLTVFDWVAPTGAAAFGAYIQVYQPLIARVGMFFTFLAVFLAFLIVYKRTVDLLCRFLPGKKELKGPKS